jgi:hypothetical protein
MTPQTAEVIVPAKVEDVWNALFDPEVLAAAMPGCEKLELVDGELVGQMAIKVGPISGKFTGKVRLEDKVEPKSYRMVVDGRGTPGFVKATATITLTPDGAKTRLAYDADAQIGGKIASVGERLLDVSARAITKQSLDGLHENIKIRAAAQVPPPSAAAPAEPTPVVASEIVPPPAPEPPPAPVYHRADANELARVVAKEVSKTILPWVLVVLLSIALVISLVTR